MTIFVIAGFFFTSAIIFYLPRHLAIMQRRALYYLLGEGEEKLLWQQWLGFATANVNGVTGAGFGEF